MPNWTKLMMVLGLWLASVSSFGSAYHEWAELNSPAFFFGLIGTLGAAIGALYAEPPSSTSSN